jgi:hypothetical protein
MDYTLIALIGNISVNVTLAVLYYYRIKIEKKQIGIMAQNAYSRECLRMLRKHIHIEKEELLKMTPQELREFLDELEHTGEEIGGS